MLQETKVSTVTGVVVYMCFLLEVPFSRYSSNSGGANPPERRTSATKIRIRAKKTRDSKRKPHTHNIYIPGAWRMLILELGHVYPWSTPPLVKTRPSLENMPPMILIIYMKDHHFWWIQWYLHFHDSFGVYPISNYPSRPHSLLVQPIDWGSFDSWCWAEKEGWWMVIDLFNGPLIDAFFFLHMAWQSSKLLRIQPTSIMISSFCSIHTANQETF